MKRRRESRGEHVELLAENWALVRAHWVLLILWDQWRALLTVLKDDGHYIVGHHEEHAIPPVGTEPYSYVVMIKLSQIRWYGNRIVSLSTGPAVDYSAANRCTVHKNYRVILKYADEDGKRAYEQLCERHDGTMTSVVQVK